MDVCGQAERCFQGIPHPGRAVHPLAGDADRGIGQREKPLGLLCPGEGLVAPIGTPDSGGHFVPPG